MTTQATQLTNAAHIQRAFEQPQWYLEGTEYNISLRSETVLELVVSRSFSSILDIGCGDGSLSLPLLNPERRLTLLDQSQAMLDIAHSRVPADLRSGVRLFKADVTTAPLDENSFDLVLCVGVLAYIEDRRQFFRKIKSVLKPGGILITECTDSKHFVSYYVRCYHALRRLLKKDPMHTVIGSSADVLAILQDLGFRMQSSFRYTLPLPVLRKFTTQKINYKAIRLVFGSAFRNRNAWLGNECIYCLTS